MTKIKINDEPFYDLIVNMKYDNELGFKGVYIPTREDIFLQNVRAGFKFNTEDNFDPSDEFNIKEDSENLDYYSIHYFLKLALENDDIAFNMLHVSKKLINNDSKIWEDLIKRKHFFYTKNIDTIINYAQNLIKNKLVNWKEISYILKCIYNKKEILQYKTITYPMIQKEFLNKIKNGQIKYKKVILILKDEINDLIKLSLESNLPMKVDKEYWNKWLFKTIHNYFSDKELNFYVGE